jgi:hypothetical protein
VVQVRLLSNLLDLYPPGPLLLWWYLLVIAVLEDPIYTGAPFGPDDPILRSTRQVDGDQKRIPPSAHTKLDYMRRKLRGSGIRYGRLQYGRPKRRVLSHPPRIKRTEHEDGGGKAAPGDG